MRSEDLRFMSRALELARLERFTRPNPKVGAVLVRDGRIVGEGAHRRAGEPHAERLALEGVDPSGGTLYVTLEPCNFRGRTDACAPWLSEVGLARVVVAMEDPDSRVSGDGIACLRDAGIEVTTGVMEDEARAMNLPYVHHRTTGRPLVTLKLALTLDGRLAAPDGSARWITGDETRREVHLRRAEAGAVLVGAGTIVADDPSLTARGEGIPEQPLRVVLDTSGRSAGRRKVFDDSAPTLVVTTADVPTSALGAWKDASVEVVEVASGDGGADLSEVLDLLGARYVIELYCEGGASLATALLAQDLADRLEIHLGPVMTGSGGPAIGDLGVLSMADALRFRTVEVRRSGDDAVLVYERND